MGTTKPRVDCCGPDTWPADLLIPTFIVNVSANQHWERTLLQLAIYCRMGRSPCCETDANVKKGPWTQEEDMKLVEYIEEHGPGNWRNLPKRAGLNRCGKSCRLRWTNYLRPDIKRGSFTEEEERLIIHYHSLLGNKWSAIAARLSGRTDNEIKNYWNTHIRKKLLTMGIDPVTHMPKTNLNLLASLPNLIAAAANINNLATNNPLITALQLPKLQLLQTLVHAMANNTSSPNMNCMNLFSHLNPNPVSSNLNNLQALLGSNPNFLNESFNYTNGGNSSTTTTTSTSFLSTPNANSTPSLVSSSPENQTVDQAQEMVNLSEVSSSSTTPSSKPFEAWRELTLDDIDSDLGWKDILDQISWTNNPL